MYQPIAHLVRKYRSYDTLIKTHDRYFNGKSIDLIDTVHNMKLIKYMYYTGLGKFDIYYMMSCFLSSCRHGLIDVAQWLYSSENEKIHVFIDDAFLSCCSNGHLDVAQWLYTLDDKIDIHSRNGSPFWYSCTCGYLDIAQWLYTLDNKIDIHLRDDSAFRYSCINGHLDVARWLYGLDGKVKIHADNDFAFLCSCVQGHINVAQWLHSLDNNMIIDLEEYDYPTNIKDWIATVKKN